MPEPIKVKCPKCMKVQDLCVCDQWTPLENKTFVLILQHPQEPDHDLNSAKIAQLSLARSDLRIGLSWRNLSAALGRPAEPSRWAVLYLGSGPKTKVSKPGLYFLSKQGNLKDAPTHLDGIVLLDGTWSQSKTLWWRNPWLLKLNRAVLQPGSKSLFENLRKEPRRECLSTLESASEALSHLGEAPELSVELQSRFKTFLQNYRRYRQFKKTPKNPSV